MYFISQFDTSLISVSEVKESINKEYRLYVQEQPNCYHCDALIDISMESDSTVFMLLANVWGEKKLIHFPFCNVNHADIWHDAFYALSQEEANIEMGNRLLQQENKTNKMN